MRFLLLGLVVLTLAVAAPGARAQPLPSSARAALLGPSVLPSPLPAASSPAGFEKARPAPPPRDRWWAMDKAEHVGASFFVVLGGQYVFEKKAALRRDPALALSLGTGAALGLAKELYDRHRGAPHDFSARDLAADALGLLLGAGVVVL